MTDMFRAAVRREPLQLARAALLFAQGLEHPELDVAAYVARLDDWAEAASRVMTAASVRRRTEQLFDFMAHDLRLRGNQVDYNDPRNSYLNDVMDRGLGLPITLSVIFLELAQRLGLEAEGVGLPGHFIVGVRDETGERHLFDPFNNGVALTHEQALELVRGTAGYAGPEDPSWFEASPPRAILARLLFNLRGTFIARQEWEKCVVVLRHLRVLQPAVAEHVRDMALAYLRLNQPMQAVNLLEDYAARKPEAEDIASLSAALKPLIDKLAKLN